MVRTGKIDMTLNYERFNSVKSARKFLIELMSPQKTPRVPRSIRAEARRILKHFPEEYHMEVVSKECPTIFGSDWRDQYK